MVAAGDPRFPVTAAEALAVPTSVGCLRRRERLRHHRTARLACPCFKKSICLPVARSDRIPILLLALGRGFKSSELDLGHASGLICGYAAFTLTVGFGPHDGAHFARVMAAAFSLSVTGAR